VTHVAETGRSLAHLFCDLVPLAEWTRISLKYSLRCARGAWFSDKVSGRCGDSVPIGRFMVTVRKKL